MHTKHVVATIKTLKTTVIIELKLDTEIIPSWEIPPLQITHTGPHKYICMYM